ncbi:MAG: hypothetical protein GXP58_11715 [Deltaproteobacteria bacterium]|nr:hypothetical protein [Deltaproteobacteria bacterium]
MSSSGRSSLQLNFVLPFNDSPVLRDRITAIFSGDLQGAEKVASSRYAKVVRFKAETGGEVKYFFYKEFLFRNLRDRLSVLVRSSRAKRALMGSLILIDHGFDTASPVCVGEERRLGIVVRSIFVTEAVPDVTELAAYLDRDLPGRDAAWIVRKRNFLKEYGRVIGRLHREGIFQGDLRERNVLVREGDPPKFFLIDNERTRRYRNLPDRKRLKNLVQANMYAFKGVTRTDRVRFFCAYLEENPGLIPQKKVWMTKILRKTRFRLRKKGRL